MTYYFKAAHFVEKMQPSLYDLCEIKKIRVLFSDGEAYLEC